MSDLAKEWLRSAKLDLDNVKCILEIEHLTPIISFHSQQAVEKSLKALLVFKSVNIKRTHSLEKLFKICESYIQITDFDIVDLLDSLYIESRYPSSMGLLPYGSPTLDDGKVFYNFALDIFTKVTTITAEI